MVMQLPLFNDSQFKATPETQDSARATIHLDRSRKTHPAVDYATGQGSRHALVPTTWPSGAASNHPTDLWTPGDGRHTGAWNNSNTERDNYRHVTGQMVMGPHPDHPDHFGELDGHGNVHDTSIKNGTYKKYGPFNTPEHQAWWDKHGETKNLRADTAIHTGQSATETETHRYITGPLDHDKPAAHVLIKDGVPMMMDGHHRTAEFRGRGNDTFPARVVNLDQMQGAITSMPKIKPKQGLDALHDHLAQAHGVAAHHLRFYDKGNGFQAHQNWHKMNPDEHVHE